MTEEIIQFSGKSLNVGEKIFALKYEIRDAFWNDNRIIVLYHPDACKGKFQNLECFSREGDKIWTAELPEPGREDAYGGITSYSLLELYAFTSYICQVDIKTGKIEKREITK